MQTIERSIWIDAPREQVWQAVTQPEQIAQWFVPNLPGVKMQRDDTGKMTIFLGEMGVDFVILELIAPLQKASLRSLPDRLLTSTYGLEEESGGTRVTVTMSGFELLPEDARQDRLDHSGASWEKTLANLKAFVAGTEMPNPHAVVGPLFGFWREDSKWLAIERSIWINASRERVWHAITDPAQIQKWFSPGSTFKSTGSGVGARLYVEEPETGAEMYVQVLEVVDPPHRLVTRSQPPETPYTTSWTLEEEKGGTRLTLTHAGYELEPADTRWTNMEQNSFGFGMMLDNLKAVVEDERIPFPQGF